MATNSESIANGVGESINRSMHHTSIPNSEDDDSFVILGSTPTPSMLLDTTAESSPEQANNEEMILDLKSAMEKSTISENDSMRCITFSYPVKMMNSQVSVGTSVLSNNTSSISLKHMSMDEIQKQFNILMEENTQMKENLLQNNNDLRREFNKIMKYQEEVRKTHDEHREKFDETRKLVNKLKSENSLLKEKLMSLSVIGPSHSEEKFWKTEQDNLKKKINELNLSLDATKELYESSVSSMNTLQKENELLKLKLNQSEDKVKTVLAEKTDLEREMERSNMEVKLLNERKDEMNAKINDFKSQFTNLTSIQHKSETLIVDLNAELKLCREQLQKAHLRLAEDKRDFEMVSEIDSHMQNSSLFTMPSSSADTLARLRVELQNCQEQLKEAIMNKVVLTMEPLSMSQNQNFSYGDSKESDVEKKVKYYEKHMEEMISWYNRHCKRINELQYILADLMPENVTSMDQLEPKMKQLKIYSNELCSDLTTEWGFFKSAQSNFQTIFNEYNNLTKEIDSITTANLINVKALTVEMERLKMELDECHAELLAKDVLMTDEVSKKQADSSEIEFLKVQLECYKKDFEEERDARNRIAGEKEQLATDLRLLQRHNEKLTLDMRELSQNVTQSSASPASNPSPASTSSSPQIVYPCPLCQFAFYTLQALENHVERCLEIQDSM